MTNHAVLQANQVASMNVDSLNRSIVSALALDNGNIVILSGRSATAGEGEVFTAIAPSSSNGLTGVWMVNEPEVVLSSGYKGLDPDPRHFTNDIGKICSAFKPQLGDIITLTAEAFSGSKGGSDTFANATDSTGGVKLVWGTSQTASVFSVKLLETTYISIADGSIGDQRVTAYKFEVVGL